MSGPELDANRDGVPDACRGGTVVFLCPGDLDASGDVGSSDLSLMLLSFGYGMPGDGRRAHAHGFRHAAATARIKRGSPHDRQRHESRRRVR